jgi:hypothetical protein
MGETHEEKSEAKKEMSDPRIAAVYRFANGMVMVFDNNGQQVPEYQGHIDDVRTKIEAAKPSHVQVDWNRVKVWG